MKGMWDKIAAIIWRASRSWGWIVLAVLGAPFPILGAPTVQVTPSELMVVYRGEPVQLTASVQGTGPFTYLWRREGLQVPGATSPTVAIANIESAEAGTYEVTVTDSLGATAKARGSVAVIDPTEATVNVGPTNISVISSGATSASSTMRAGTQNSGVIDRALLRFNLSTIPADAFIQSARVRVTVVQVPSSPQNSNFALYRLLKNWDATASWTEAGAGSPWSSPGGDFSSTTNAIRLITGLGDFDFGPTAALSADVQNWLANPNSNHGWLLKSESEEILRTARHFDLTPELIVDYFVPLQAPQLKNIHKEGTELVFHLDGQAGRYYLVNARDNIDSGNWTEVLNVPARAATNSLSIRIPIAPSRKFFRVEAR